MGKTDVEKQRQLYIALCGGRQASRERLTLERTIGEKTAEVAEAQKRLIKSIRRLQIVRERNGQQPIKSERQLAVEAKAMCERLRKHPLVERIEAEISDRFHGLRVRTVEMELHPHPTRRKEPRRGCLEIVIDAEGGNGVAQIRVLPVGEKDANYNEVIPLPDQLIKGLPEVVAVHRYDAAVFNCLRWAEKFIAQRVKRTPPEAADRKEGQATKAGAPEEKKEAKNG